jgi:hypothetical protein
MCSAYGEFNRPQTDLWHIRRIHGDPGMLRLKNWLTLDPRKLRRKKQFPFNFPPFGDGLAIRKNEPATTPDTFVIPPLPIVANIPTANV